MASKLSEIKFINSHQIRQNFDSSGNYAVANNQLSPATTLSIFVNGSNDGNSRVADFGGVVQFFGAIFCFATICLATIVGNVLVISGILVERSLKTAANYFLVSLAVADLAIGVIVAPVEAFLEMAPNSWAIGSELCSLWLAIGALSSSASIFGSTAIACFRYLAVVRPFAFSSIQIKSPYLASLFPIAVVWLLATAVAFPVIFGVKDPSMGCAVTSVNYLFYSSLFSFCIPTTCVVFLYVSILLKLAKRSKRNEMRKSVRSLSTSEAAGERAALVLCRTMTVAGVLNTTNGGLFCRPPSTVNVIPAHSLVSAMGVTKKNGGKVRIHESLSARVSICNSEYDANVDDKSKFHRHGSKRSVCSFLSSCSSSNIDVVTPHNSEIDLVALFSDLVGQELPTNAANFLSNNKNGGANNNSAIRNEKNRAQNRRPSTVELAAMKKRAMSVKRDRKSAVILVAILLFYLICRCPSFGANMINWMCQISSLSDPAAIGNCRVNQSFSRAFLWLGYCNSLLNPLLYALFNIDLRRNLRRILCKRLF